MQAKARGRSPLRDLSLQATPPGPVLPSAGVWWMLTRCPWAVSFLPLELMAASFLPPQIILPNSSLPTPGRIPDTQPIGILLL